jgi:hypothetical protein
MQPQPILQLKEKLADLKLGGFSWSNRAVWSVAALIIILIVNRLISPNFFSIEMEMGASSAALINILDARRHHLLSIGMTLGNATRVSPFGGHGDAIASPVAVM